MREVDAFVEKPEGKELSEAIYEKFKALKGFLGEEPLASMEKRKQQKEVWDKMVELAAKQFGKFTELKKPITYCKNKRSGKLVICASLISGANK